MKITDTPSDKDILDWLSGCESIDHTGQDSGWAFNRMIYPLERKGSKVCDIRIAIRGFDGLDGLRSAVIGAMIAEEELQNSYPGRASRKHPARERTKK